MTHITPLHRESLADMCFALVDHRPDGAETYDRRRAAIFLAHAIEEQMGDDDAVSLEQAKRVYAEALRQGTL
ncbi:hypothetical protein JF66_19460 [Cryobacterium sp. MLB-32]|uniref:hypothetical protein n=1 Tax=Cryobacterium sp. MLB-32 TaxID=1529318 RepID=UPI0004E724C8|nr:hypothetical protein [Cryobacterium sp. MLB-32]KFF58313.1 hypothetical protein JF66_19460 [Cryobacterium sp. MLB-32]